MNARYAWDRGIKGAGVRVLDVECGLNEQHEDIHFAGNYLKSGTNFASYASEHGIPAFNDCIQHGTAVAGVIAGQHNGYGISGLAPEVEFGLVSLFETATTGGTVVAPAIGVNAAAADDISRYGDVVLIEVNSALPEADRVGCVTASGKASGPAEITLDGHSAVRAASLTGRIVVEGAANDGQQLETCFPEADLQNRINRNAPGFLDSGAIMVGAGYYNPSNTSEPIGIPYFTGFKYNYGNRLDVHGWGANVTTAGSFGLGLPGLPSDLSQAYTKKFNGTSSASAVVAGATALVQGYYKTLTRPNNPFQGLNGFEMRQLLVNTGTPQQPATDPQNNQSMHIGPLPNVATAMDPYLIYPMIKANGLRNNVNDPNDPNCQPCIKIARGSTVNLDMSIWDEKFTGTPVDWWFTVNWNGTSYYYTIDQGWITQQKPWFKNANGLYGFWDWRWGSMRFDYPGTYTFFFGVDTIQNDTFMGNNNAISPSLYYDYVKIVVQ